jgi:hypothetical protein
MGFLNLLQIIAGLLPVVKESVSIAESMFGPKQGTAKLAAAVDLVNAAMPKAEEFAQHVDTVAAVVKPLIQSVVAAANASGVFTKSKPAASPIVRQLAPVAAAVASSSPAAQVTRRAPAEVVGEHDVPQPSFNG